MTLKLVSAESPRFSLLALVFAPMLCLPVVAAAQQDQQFQLRARDRSLVAPDPTPAPAKPFHGVRYKAQVVGQKKRVRGESVPYQCNVHPNLQYFGGPVITNVQPITVFWSQNVNAALTPNTTGIAQFLADLGNSTYMNVVRQYSTYGVESSSNQSSDQWIGSGSATPEAYTLVPSKCSGTATCTVSDTDIQNELNAQIAANKLPAPTYDALGNPNTLYMTYFPPNVHVSGPDGAGGSCVSGGFCAYHNTGTYSGDSNPLLYGVLMDNFTSACAQGCGANATAMENQTDVSSHEFAEAITDADIGLDTQFDYANPAGWGDNNCGEIADICDADSAGDTITVDGRSWVVQELWSNKANQCESTGPSIPAPFLLGATSPENQGTQFSSSLTAETLGGATNTTYTGTVHFTSSDPAASLPADYTFTSGNAGVTSFNATFNTSGTQTITVTDISNGTLTGTESILVNAQVVVPNVVGDTQSAAFNAITGAGLNVGTTSQQASKTVPSGNVISESPSAGTAVSPGSSVNLVISIGDTAATLTSPTGGSLLAGPSVTFIWTSVSGATGYAFRLGTTQGGNNLWSSGPITNTSATAKGLPTDGSTVYGRLYTNYGSFEVYNDYTFTATTRAALTSPTGGSTLAGPTVTFNWSTTTGARGDAPRRGSTATGVTGYALRLGTTQGGNNIWSSGPIDTTSATARGLPTDGSTVYARLYTEYGSASTYIDYTFTAATRAALTSPTGGSVLTGATEVFNWTTAAGATQYAIRYRNNRGRQRYLEFRSHHSDHGHSQTSAHQRLDRLWPSLHVLRVHQRLHRLHLHSFDRAVVDDDRGFRRLGMLNFSRRNPLT